jgi:uncharacterized protein (DUF488 family)
MVEQLQVLTWGYQHHKVADLRALVADRGVDLIVDVRANPYSKQDSWTKEGLEATFGDRYLWIGWFGERGWRRGETQGGLRNPSRGMAELRTAVRKANAERVLLLCYEADAGECHRSQVATLIQERLNGSSVEIKHVT